MSTPGDQKKGVRSGVIDDIENALTAGYGKKEDLRALDKDLREKYYSELMALHHQWEKIYLEVLEAGQTAIGRECKKAIQTMDRLAATVNRADYGYAPIFDRVQKIQTEALSRVLEYDKNLASNLNQLSKDVAAAEASLRESTWPLLRTLVDTLNRDLAAFDESWRKRKQAMSGS